MIIVNSLIKVLLQNYFNIKYYFILKSVTFAPLCGV